MKNNKNKVVNNQISYESIQYSIDVFNKYDSLFKQFKDKLEITVNSFETKLKLLEHELKYENKFEDSVNQNNNNFNDIPTKKESNKCVGFAIAFDKMGDKQVKIFQTLTEVENEWKTIKWFCTCVMMKTQDNGKIG